MQSQAASMTTLDKLDPSLMGRIRISTVICYASCWVGIPSGRFSGLPRFGIHVRLSGVALLVR
jgi:hypothetical protein